MLLFLTLALVYTYPLGLAPAEANRLDSPDALLNAWIVSWDLRQLASDPWHLFDANIFHPEKGALAYSENLVTAALLAAPVRVVSDNPILLYNAALLLGFAATGLATYRLALRGTGCRLAAVLAGVLFAFAPYRWAHLPHLQLEIAFGLPLGLYFTERLAEGGRETRTGRARSAAGLALALVLTFGSSVYTFVYLLTVLPIVAVGLLVGSSRPRRHALAGLGAGLAAGAVLTLPLALPYLEKLRGGTERSLAAAATFSASPVDYLASFSAVHGFLPKTSEPLFPGFAALALAALALVSRRVPARTKWIWAGVAAAGIALSLGPRLGVFTLLYEWLPPYRALRVPSRAGVLFLLAVAVLAAHGLARLRGGRARKARVALLALAAAECFAGPLPLSMEPPEIPPIYEAVRRLDGEGALVELPLPPPRRFQDNAAYVYRSTVHWRPLVNGYSGFVPETYRRSHRRLMRGELAAGLREMSRAGLRFVLAHESRLGPRMRRQIDEARRTGALSLIEEDGTDRLYELNVRRGTPAP